MLMHHANGALADLGENLLTSSWLHPLKGWSLLKTRGDSIKLVWENF
jgi:hypothetical protein